MEDYVDTLLKRTDKMSIQATVNPLLEPGQILIKEQYRYPRAVYTGFAGFLARHKIVDPKENRRWSVFVISKGFSESLKQHEELIYQPWVRLLGAMPKFFKNYPRAAWHEADIQKLRTRAQNHPDAFDVEHASLKQLIEWTGLPGKTERNWAHLFIEWPVAVKKMADLPPEDFTKPGKTDSGKRRASLIQSLNKTGRDQERDLRGQWQGIIDAIGDLRMDGDAQKKGITGRKLQAVLTGALASVKDRSEVERLSPEQLEQPSSRFIVGKTHFFPRGSSDSSFETKPYGWHLYAENLPYRRINR